MVDVGTGHQSGMLMDELGGARHASSARAILNRLKPRRRGALFALGAIIVAVIAVIAVVAYFSHSHSMRRGSLPLRCCPSPT